MSGSSDRRECNEWLVGLAGCNMSGSLDRRECNEWLVGLAGV